jgi:hypothetical protein
VPEGSITEEFGMLSVPSFLSASSVSLSTPNGRSGLAEISIGCLFGLAFLPQDIFIVNCEDVSQETKSDFLITRKANDFSKRRKEKQMTWHTQPRKRHNELKKMPVYVHQKKNELMDMLIYVHC